MKRRVINFSDQEIKHVVKVEEPIQKSEDGNKCKYGEECSIVMSDGLEYFEV